MMIFYCAPGSSSMATHIALHETGAAFEHRWLSFNAKEQKGADYLSLNPEGKVPALVIDGKRVLTEVAATLYYLAKTYPAAGLWPQGGPENSIWEEAQALSWMSFIAATVHPSRRAGEEAWRAVFRLCEEKLAGREWAVGDRYSLADIHLFRLFWRFVDALHPPASDYPGMMAHYERIMARPAVRKTIEIERQIGYEFPRGSETL